MTDLPPSSVASKHFHTDEPLIQIGWLGHRDGHVYRLDEDPTKTEPGGFTPIYCGWGDTCGHQITPDADGDVPGWEGTTGPGPGQYGRPHVYARDVQSGAGNCVCGHHLGHRLHVQAAPGVDIPARCR